VLTSLAGAIKDYNHAIRLQPDYADAYFNRAIARKANNYLIGALADYDKVLRLNPDFTDAYYNRAKIWEQKENHSKAIADYQKYLDLGGGIRDGYQKDVEKKIKELKSKLIRKKICEEEIEIRKWSGF